MGTIYSIKHLIRCLLSGVCVCHSVLLFFTRIRVKFELRVLLLLADCILFSELSSYFQLTVAYKLYSSLYNSILLPLMDMSVHKTFLTYLHFIDFKILESIIYYVLGLGRLSAVPAGIVIGFHNLDWSHCLHWFKFILDVSTY